MNEYLLSDEDQEEIIAEAKERASFIMDETDFYDAGYADGIRYVMARLMGDDKWQELLKR